MGWNRDPDKLLKGRRALGGVKALLALRENDPPCVCGKERFYSEEAAQAALRAIAARRIIQFGEVSERASYVCKQAYYELGVDVWHLTSNDGQERNWAVKAKAVERELEKKGLA